MSVFSDCLPIFQPWELPSSHDFMPAKFLNLLILLPTTSSHAPCCGIISCTWADLYTQNVSTLPSPFFRTFTHLWDVFCFWFKLEEKFIYPFTFFIVSQWMMSNPSFRQNSVGITSLPSHFSVFSFIADWRDMAKPVCHHPLSWDNSYHPHPPAPRKESLSVCLFVAQNTAGLSESSKGNNRLYVCTQSEECMFRVSEFKSSLLS